MKFSKFKVRAAVFARFVTMTSLVFCIPACTLWQPGVWDPSANLLTKDLDEIGGKSGTPEMLHSSSTLSRQSRETISLAVEFKHVSAASLDEQLWNRIDETAFSSEVRQSWLENGLRIGLITASDVAFAADRLAADSDAGDPINALLAGAEVLGKQADGNEVIPLRPAHRHELPLSPPLEGQQVVLLKRPTGLLGQQFDSPQLLLALTARRGPREGQATLEVRPEIHHGAVRQQFVSSETAVRIHAGRERWELPEMNLSWISQAGTTCIIAPAIEDVPGEPTFGLGRQMLQDKQHMEDDQHLIVLLQIEP